MSTLYIVATPIGNQEDITLRALQTLFSVDVILCEDTRKTGLLLHSYKTKEPFTKIIQIILVSSENQPKLRSFYDEVEEQKIPEVIALLESGKSVALVSDAGTPLVADPGYKLIQACIRNRIPVVPIPGPSAVITALVGSGLPPDRFAFLGYFPLKKGKQETILAQIKISKENGFVKTFIFYESPHRLLDSLLTIQQSLGDIPIVIAREMTKIHEEFFRGTLSKALEYFQNPKGEFVILI